MAKSKASKLNLTSTSDCKSEYSTILLYGDNGSGKTTFAGTWPNPVFLVPGLALNEMRTLEDYDLPVVTFDTIPELRTQIGAITKAILRNELICDTLVVDNLTAMQLLVEEQLKSDANKTKLEWEEWGQFSSLFSLLMKELHSLPCHVIWITHEVVKMIDNKAVGELTLTGKSKNFIPGFADMILRMEVVDLKKAGLKYKLHLKGHNIWNVRLRGDRDKIASLPPELIDPCYDDLAGLLDWPLRAELEGEEGEETVAE